MSRTVAACRGLCGLVQTSLDLIAYQVGSPGCRGRDAGMSCHHSRSGSAHADHGKVCCEFADAARVLTQQRESQGRAFLLLVDREVRTLTTIGMVISTHATIVAMVPPIIASVRPVPQAHRLGAELQCRCSTPLPIGSFPSLPIVALIWVRTQASLMPVMLRIASLRSRQRNRSY